MSVLLQHRGPDGNGFHCNERVGLGNVRLAILDPGNGEQPFNSDDGKVSVVQNGEIFNFRELRQELEKLNHSFFTDNDTEIILKAYLEWGIDFVPKLNGMFAIAICDERSNKFYLIRDRIGEKPLYYYQDNDLFLFASEIKALLPYIEKRVNVQALNDFLTLNYIPAPLTGFLGVFHVMPGTVMELGASPKTWRWWDLRNQKVDSSITEKEWIEEFNSLLHDATRLRLVSDVPFGAFLSGGVDSSSVVGTMSRIMDKPVRTYSIGFPDPRFDESRYAQEAARLFSTEHTNETVDYNIIGEWPKYIYFCDQPHGDVSFMPMRRVSELAARDVKMVLTGDGADELFAGYEKYAVFFEGETKAIGCSLKFYEKYSSTLRLFGLKTLDSIWKACYKDRVDFQRVDKEIQEYIMETEHYDNINKALLIDMQYLLAGNNLVKPDRMAMSHSLETRAPFLDYRMMEFAFRTPGEFKLKNGDKKYLFKKAVTPLIGQSLAYRKKQMFTVPIGEWFKTSLRSFCREILLSSESRVLEYFNKEVIELLVNDHLSQKRNNTREIRSLISLEYWLKEFF